MKKKVISFKIKPSELIKAIQNSNPFSDEMIQLYLSEVEDLKVDEELLVKITPDDYDRFEGLVKKYKVNLKDVRDVIMLAYSWWAKSIGSKLIEEEVFEYFLLNKDKIRENIYSEEIILTTIDSLSKCSNPVIDFYSRIKKINPREYMLFEEYYKKVYENRK